MEPLPTMQSRGTVVKSFRLSKELVQMISDASHYRGITETTYVSSILQRNVKMQRLFRNIDGIATSQVLFRQLVGQMSVSALEILGLVSKVNIPFCFDLLGFDLTVAAFKSFIREYLQDLGWMKIEEVHGDSSVE